VKTEKTTAIQSNKRVEETLKKARTH